MATHSKKRLRTEQEDRLRRVIISKIKRLREAPNLDVVDDEEEDQLPQDQPTTKAAVKPTTSTASTKPAASAPVTEPEPEPVTEPEPAPVAEPEMDTEPTEPAEEPKTGFNISDPSNPDDTEGDMIDEPVPDVEGDDGDQSKIRQAKVKLFFNKLESNPTLMNYLTFHSPLEQAEAIMQFAELVKVPRSQLLPLIKTIRNISQEPETAPTAESIAMRRKLVKTLKEYLNYKNKFKR